VPGVSAGQGDLPGLVHSDPEGSSFPTVSPDPEPVWLVEYEEVEGAGVSEQLSAFSYQPSAFSLQPLAISYQLSAISFFLAIGCWPIRRVEGAMPGLAGYEIPSDGQWLGYLYRT